MSEKRCLSCKKNIANMIGTVTFLCPNCTKAEITRCVECRKNVVKYVCPECGFEGPN
ncbi:RNA-binding protein [Candidatus Woesearchaeota archaeon]|nr:RNA-binding protein [Candidatus Woesearchaeota archaeon]